MSSLVVGQTSNANENAVFGRNDATNPPPGAGVQGAGIFGLTFSPGAAGVFGSNNSAKGVGVQGNGPEAGLSGFSEQGAGVTAHSNHANAIQGFAHDPNGNAILAINDATVAPTDSGGSPRGSGILAVTSVPGAAGVFGSNNAPRKGIGVQGNGPERGLSGFSDAGSGAVGQSNKGSGVLATSHDGQGLTVYSDNDVALFAQGGAFAGVFNGALVVNKGPNVPGKTPNTNGNIVINEGDVILNKGSVYVKGDVVLSNADCAEDFRVSGAKSVEPGTVMVLDGEGAVSESAASYDKRVAGVVSGAGTYKPGLILDRQAGEPGRVPLALMGKVYCKVDAQYGPVSVGDLLTTSPTPGHAMKAKDTDKAFGAVIGKALRPITAGQGLIPILIALQ
jgi:hypothetical protein